MAQVIGNNQVKLSSGKTVQAQQGGWYDGQQFWGGTLSQPGQINTQSNQQGAGQAVSREVIAQTNPANVAYIDQQRQQAGLSSSPNINFAPTATPSNEATTSGGGGVGFTGPEAINLPQLYEGLYAKSGVRDVEAGLTEKTNQYNDAVAKIKNNPYLSEATMTGRINKLDQKFSADTANIKNDIAMRKADIETQLNLQTKQLDINNEQTRMAWDQFNTLLSNGALDNASGEDISNLTRSTGISSSMIQSAVGISRQKNAPKANTQVIQIDDGENISAVVIDQDTGRIINKQVLGASTPTAAETKASLGGGGGGGKTSKTDYVDYLKQDAQSGLTLSQIFSIYSGYLSPDEIYRIYNASSKYGPDKGKVENLAKYGVTQPKSTSSRKP